MEKDENGYPRGKVEHSDLIHRQIAYSEIYLKNKDKYPLPFSRYQIHHKDGDKENFMPDNLQIVTKDEHRKIHRLPSENKNLENYKKQTTKQSPNKESYFEDFTSNPYSRGYVSKETLDNLREKNKKEWSKKKPNIKNKRKYWILGIVIFLILCFVFYPQIKDRIEMKNWADLPQTTPNVPVTLPPYVVKGSQKEVIIENNLQKEIALNVTYRVYSKWFGTDRIENQVFEVSKNTTKTFLVYDNAGCGVGDCSVSILNERRIE